jgi:outer membrane lipoprotein carrier protein
MKKLLFALLCLFTLNHLMAQSPAPAPPKPETSDPAAKKVLDKIRKKYNGYKTLELTFSLNIEVPGETTQVQKGAISQSGDNQYRLDMNDQIIISDGKTTWVYLKKGNEVQINDADPKDTESGLYSPKDLLNRYNKGDYLYAITDKVTEGGKVYTHIEFKPKDKSSEYSKLRLSIDEKSGTIQSIKAFAKDGSRYTFTVKKLTPNKVFDASYFKFDASKFPGAKVEDLRM